MKIDNLDLICPAPSNVINMSFRDPTSTNPFIAKSITGLDADEIVPRYYGRTGTGASLAKFYEMSLEKRDIIIQLKLNPDYTANQSYSDLRDEVYKFVASSRTGRVSLFFKYGDDEVAFITGFISKIESQQFVTNPEMQITIQCDDPMLRGTEVSLDLDDLDNEEPIITDPLSTAPHGFKFFGTFSVVTSTFTIQNLDTPEFPDWSFEIAPVGGFFDLDVLYFSSEYNDKQVWMSRSGVITQLVDRVVPGSVWPILFPGDNYFVTDGTLGFDIIRYTPAYWGV